MQYLGGKTLVAKQLAAVMLDYRRPGQEVWDAFCGGLSVAAALEEDGPVYATDVNAALISLYAAVQGGWQPPDVVSRETWTAAKVLPDSDPLKAFCGFGCSFGGKWFGGYAGPRSSPKTATHHGGTIMNAVVSSLRMLDRRATDRSMTFAVVDFLAVAPRPIESLIYCDPPYAGTTGYDGVPSFDQDAFRARVAEWSRHTDVFVSEYDFPLGACIWSAPATLKVSGGTKGPRTERLYRVSSVPEAERYRRPPIHLMFEE
jgi:DNA adenine methylase